MVKRCKAGGKTGILFQRVIGPILWGKLLQLIENMWRDGEVVADWKDASVKEGRSAEP